MVTSSKSSGLLKLVEERLLTKKIEEEKKLAQISYIPKDCISNILARLPVDSIQRSRFVCKPWYDVVRDPKFIDAHLQSSESVLIFLSPIAKESKKTQVGENGRASTLQKKGNTVPVESKLLDPNSIPMFGHPALNSPKNCVKFLEFKNGKSGIGEYSLSCWASDIKATCNGLILLDNNLKKGGVIVLNPVTKKLIALPVGTLCNHPDEESYGFAMSDVTGEYKVVHLFLDQLGPFACCEIFSLYKKTWREVNGPSIELVDNGGFGHAPVSAIGALHWPFYRSDYVVSMEVDEEKFHHIELPKSCTTHDRIIEICGCLGFVTHEDMNHIDIWILTSLCGEEWTKNHSITVDTKRDMVPLCSLRFKGDIIFHTSDGSFYAYDFQQQQMTEIIGKINRLPWCLPHVNSLVTWDARE